MKSRLSFFQESLNFNIITMKIKFLGAAGGEVTGSAYLLQTNQSSLLVECGLFQGGKKAEALNRFEPSDLNQIKAVLITHAHLDHTGRLPLLAKMGIFPPVYATAATLEITALILKDSAHVQEAESRRINRKRARAGLPPIKPLYSLEDAEAIIRHFRPIPYDTETEIAPGFSATFAEAGHLLGSACIQLTVTEKKVKKKIVISGDLGPKGVPILQDYKALHGADLVMMEATYGDREHRPLEETIQEFVDIVKRAVKENGKILIPTFAVGRAQLLIDLLAHMFRTGQVKPFPIFLDSPMAIEASAIYLRHPELYDEEMISFVKEKPLMEDLRTLKLCPAAADSMAINEAEGPFMVLAGAGMCNAGRILHHLKYHLWKPETHVIIVGYQGYGTLGRQLVDGAVKVRIFGETIAVRAQIHTLGGFSAHAGQSDLLEWFRPLAACHPRLLIVHGENKPRETLAKEIRKKFRITAELPQLGQEMTL